MICTDFPIGTNGTFSCCKVVVIAYTKLGQLICESEFGSIFVCDPDEFKATTPTLNHVYKGVNINIDTVTGILSAGKYKYGLEFLINPPAPGTVLVVQEQYFDSVTYKEIYTPGQK
jgi:hypothetical protein